MVQFIVNSVETDALSCRANEKLTAKNCAMQQQPLNICHSCLLKTFSVSMSVCIYVASAMTCTKSELKNLLFLWNSLLSCRSASISTLVRVFRCLSRQYFSAYLWHEVISICSTAGCPRLRSPHYPLTTFHFARSFALFYLFGCSPSFACICAFRVMHCYVITVILPQRKEKQLLCLPERLFHKYEKCAQTKVYYHLNGKITQNKSNTLIYTYLGNVCTT